MKINTHNVIVQLAGLLIIIVVTFNFVNIVSHVEEVHELKARLDNAEKDIEDLKQMTIVFENMHGDHYGFEEHKVLELIDKDKANDYKAFLDSIKNK